MVGSNRVLVVTSVDAEREAVARGVQHTQNIDIIVSGVGIASAAAYTATALATTAYSLVVSAGIAGGFSGRADIGSLVVASDIIAADLGAESPEGFYSLEKLGFGPSRIQADPQFITRLTKALLETSLTVHTGAILSLSTVTGTALTAEKLVRCVPSAMAEAMEGFGVATAAQIHQVPVLEIRAISNLIGPRDRSLWRIEDALHTLEIASSTLLEVIK